METPDNLKKIYRHFEYHINPKLEIQKGISINKNIIKDIEKFAGERMLIWERKIKKCNPPFTKDKILQKYKFCNIYRELDKQTIDLHTLLAEYRKDLPFWLLNTAFYRFICNSETIRKIGLLSFNKSNNKKVYKRLINLPKPKYGNAYIFPISLIQKTNYPTREKFFCFYLPILIQKILPIVKEFNRTGMLEAVTIICKKINLNFKFHFTEILIDFAYQFPNYIDLYKEFYIGPGSIPTMKLLSDSDPVKTCQYLTKIKLHSFPYLEYFGKEVLLSAENWEGIGCEYRKYINLKKGTGRKRYYLSN